MNKRRLSFEIETVDISTPLLKSKKARTLLKEIFVSNIPEDVSFKEDSNSNTEVNKLKQEEIKVVKNILNFATTSEYEIKTPKPVTPNTQKLLDEMFQKSVKAIEKTKPIRSIRF
ncbi:hypothetical protein PVAND_000755 [Polypedilum vanderplanki]|uniref:Uncharacterized protein n=1 Tax=Polypedilum vanderplanki TaxID=319348 RepID=A0A9J6BL50_POLVA|nr:hypothetical protein PVAND_000755 [Polypedilum vanderplanki]